MLQYKRQHLIAMISMIANALLLLVLPYLTMKIIDIAIKESNVRLLVKYALLYLIVAIFQNGSKLLTDYYYSVIGKRIVYDLRFQLITHLQKLSGRYYSNIKAGELTAVINNDVAAVEELATKMIFSTLSDVFISTAMLVFLFQLQFDLLIVSIALQPLMMYIQSRLTKKTTQATMDLRSTFGDFSAITHEFFSSLMHFAILNAKKHFFHKYIPISKKFMKVGIELEMTFSLSMISVGLITDKK